MVVVTPSIKIYYDRALESYPFGLLAAKVIKIAIRCIFLPFCNCLIYKRLYFKYVFVLQLLCFYFLAFKIFKHPVYQSVE